MYFDDFTVEHVQTPMVQVDDYYLFGLTMAGRNYQDSLYRYGFNGKEKDDQGEWGSTNYDYGARIYNPKLGRWLSLDPLQSEYPGMSPYHAIANSPTWYVDRDGRDNIIYIFLNKDFEKAALKKGFDKMFLINL